MVNVHAARSAGWSAVCFVILAVISILLTASFPPANTKPADLAAYVDVHRTSMLWSAWLIFPSAAFFLWFSVGLRDYLRQGTGRQEGLPTYMLVASAIIAMTAFVQAYLQSAIAYTPPDAFVSQSLASIYVGMLFTIYGLGFAPIAIYAFAAAHSMRRHRTAPAWLAWLGYLAALACSVATLCIFFMNPALGPEGVLSLLAVAVAFIWLLATGIVMIRTPQPPV